MLNKRVKSLLAAGILIFNISGTVFAEGTNLPAEGTIKIENPDFEDKTYKKFEFQDSNIILWLYKDSDGYRANITWMKENYKVTGIKLIYDDGSFSEQDIMIPGEAAEGQDCYVAVPDGDTFVVGTQHKVGDKKLVKVEIVFENLTKSDDPVTPPVDPNPTPDPEQPPEKVIDPETGDAGIMSIVAVATVSAAGLFALRKKDDEE